VTTTDEDAALFDDGLARRNAVILAVAQAIGGAVMPIGIATGTLVAVMLAPEAPALATAPMTALVLGSAAGSAPAALYMKRVGRRTGFLTGAGMAALGSLVAVAAILAGSFLLFIAGLFLAGVSSAFVQQYRFAATDIASPGFRPKAISYVMIGGIFSGIVGPQSAIHGRTLFPTAFVGAYAIAVALSLLTAAVLCFLVLPRPAAATHTGGGRPLGEILRQPRFLVALACAICSFAMMSFVMTSTPLAMVQHFHHGPDAATETIQWHIVAMYAPSLVTGTLIARLGKEVVVAVGLLLIAACAAVALSGVDIHHFSLALILLGVGWNFGFIGATAMLTETYRPEEAPKVQAANDFILFGFVAAASLSSGFVLSGAGWNVVNLAVLPAVAACLLLLGWSRLPAALRRSRRA